MKLTETDLKTLKKQWKDTNITPQKRTEKTITFLEVSDQAESCESGTQQAGGSVEDLQLYMHAPRAPKALPERELTLSAQ